MQDYQQRVIDEKTELEGKIDRLDLFLVSEKVESLPADERERMIRQLRIMKDYSNVLTERITAFV